MSANNTTSTSAGGEVTFPVPKKCGYLFTNNKSFSKLFSPGKHQLQADRENVLMSPSSVRKSPRVKLSTRSPCHLTSGSLQKISESNQADQHSTGSSDCLTKLSAVTPSLTITTVTNNFTTSSTTPQKMRPRRIERSASNTAAVSNVTHHCSITPPAHTAKYGTVTPQHRALLKAKGTPKYSPVTESDLQSLMKSPYASVNTPQNKREKNYVGEFLNF